MAGQALGGNRNTAPKGSNGPKGQHPNHAQGGAKPTQFSADQRKLLSKIRPVIPKERASDEELMTMLVDQNMNSDRVVQQFFEAGNTESEWRSETNKRDKQKKKDDMKRPNNAHSNTCLLYTSPSPRDRTRSRMPSSA
eukprot:TRINITY_DN3269_c0_g1_i1.p2 TRINITY_DN3269_c0_g1~~TRINITY_DN3269_c0_g1_i1.p2  ORF type:complete len:138 (-),score=40.09 TRINITY_DN3269_c0_g1_i1:115-528(-)